MGILLLPSSRLFLLGAEKWEMLRHMVDTEKGGEEGWQKMRKVSERALALPMLMHSQTHSRQFMV